MRLAIRESEKGGGRYNNINNINAFLALPLQINVQPLYVS